MLHNMTRETARGRGLMTYLVGAKETIYLIIISVLLTPFLAMWHEMGHFIVIKILGGDAIINPTNVWPTADFYIQLTQAQRTLITAGGPIFDFLIFATAATLLCLRRFKVLNQTTTIYEKCLFFFSLLSMMWVIEPIYYLFFWDKKYKNLDEIKIAEGLGLDLFSLLWIMFAVGGIISYFALKHWPKKRRFFDTITVGASVYLSLMMWVYWLGPFLKMIYRAVRHKLTG